MAAKTFEKVNGAKSAILGLWVPAIGAANCSSRTFARSPLEHHVSVSLSSTPKPGSDGSTEAEANECTASAAMPSSPPV
jgi:hypothetical protein